MNIRGARVWISGVRGYWISGVRGGEDIRGTRGRGYQGLSRINFGDRRELIAGFQKGLKVASISFERNKDNPMLFMMFYEGGSPKFDGGIGSDSRKERRYSIDYARYVLAPLPYLVTKVIKIFQRVLRKDISKGT